jgi:hypothetical protein
LILLIPSAEWFNANWDVWQTWRSLFQNGFCFSWITFLVDYYVLEVVFHFRGFFASEAQKLLFFLSISFNFVLDNQLFDSLRTHSIIQSRCSFPNEERVWTYARNHNCFRVSSQWVLQHPC